jgi:hypothetical protein
LLAGYQEEKRFAKVDEKTIRERVDRKCLDRREYLRDRSALITVDK